MGGAARCSTCHCWWVWVGQLDVITAFGYGWVWVGQLHVDVVTYLGGCGYSLPSSILPNYNVLITYKYLHRAQFINFLRNYLSLLNQLYKNHRCACS